ncbi:MAG: BatD family protein, partial [Tannerellaceae bacterium]|nr:BatD family protein [Tannerellaceae bacterium]
NTSNGLTGKVLPGDKAAAAGNSQTQEGNAPAVSDNDIFMRMTVSKNSVYEQEGFLVTFKLYTLVDPSFRSYKFPEFEGFLAQEVELPENKQFTLENYNGRNYQSVILKQTVLYPQRSGKITIEGGRFEAIVRVPTQQRVRSIFDDFFATYRDVNKTLTTAPVTIDVKPLPSGKPASYSGGVGDFNMTASISSDRVKANEAVTVNIKIDGTGNIRLVKNPEVIFPNDFDAYDPKVETNIRTTAAGVSGSKMIEYMAIPRYGGDFEIPAIQFSYFDLKSNSYKTLTAGPYKLHVEKGEGGDTNSPVVSNFGNRENVRYLGQDIRYLKVKGFNFVSKSDIFYGSFMYLLCYLIPAILFIVFFIVYRKQIKENSNLALVRTKKANKMAVKRLKIAGKLLKENKREEFYEEVLRALWGYLSDKLSIPQADLTKDNVEVELNKYGVDEALINEFMEILNTCEFARYAPSQGHEEMDKLYEMTVDAIGKMENTIKK